jgi:hypothetical protein
LSLTAFFLDTLAAFAHSIWNLLAKRASRNQHFIWFSSIGEAVLLLAPGIWSLADSWSMNGDNMLIRKGLNGAEAGVEPTTCRLDQQNSKPLTVLSSGGFPVCELSSFEQFLARALVSVGLGDKEEA